MGWNAKYNVTAAMAAAFAIALSVPALAQVVDKSVKFDAEKIRLAAASPMPSLRIPAAPANGEMTFVFSDFSEGVYPGWDACPTGWAATIREGYLASVSLQDRARLLRPENEPELTEKWKASALGPEGTNICTNYDQFPDRPLQSQVQNKVAYGLNLDGDASEGSKDPYVCAHENFSSPLGEKGIDNQAYRALGCSRQFRGPDGGNGEVVQAYKGQLATGQYTVVMIVRGVDSLVNDDNVEVILGSSDQQPIVDGQQNFIPNASYHISANAHWRNVLRGRIVDGVLTTESKDIYLKKGSAYGAAEWDLQRTKLRLAFRTDGTVEGLLGGYESIFEPLRNQVRGGRGTIKDAGSDCAAKWNTLKKLADGGRDPVTGQCNRVSNAYRVTAAPAFVFDHPPASTKTAAVK